MSETLYNVSLKQLARDGKKAGADLPPAELSHIPAKQFRVLLDSVGALAPTVEFPVEPEMRVTTTAGNFVVQVKGGKLHLVSWSSRHKGGEHSAQQIYAIITGEETGEAASASSGAGGWLQEKMSVMLLLLAILAVNSFTIWFVTRPKKTMVPRYTLLAAGPAERVLSSVAGVYETGGAEGDRRMEIDKAGKVQRYKLGKEHALKNPQLFTVQAADAGGKPALLTNTKSLITINDSLTVVLYGDKYKRVSP